jgi:hypothetical protein
MKMKRQSSKEATILDTTSAVEADKVAVSRGSLKAIRAMTAARIAKAEIQLALDQVTASLFGEWVRADADKYSNVVKMREMYGIRSPEAIDAYRDWYENLTEMPHPLPTNGKAWQ